jgi:hypothetical protein
MTAAGRFPLFAVPGVERPVLASKPLLVRHGFQHCDGQESANSRPKSFQRIVILNDLLGFKVAERVR